MKKFVSAILISGIFVVIGCSPPPPSSEAKAFFAEKGIDSTQTALILRGFKNFPTNTQLSIAIISDTTTNFLGLKRTKDSTMSISNKDAIFEIGSISSIFTSTLLADFVEYGKIQLTDSISKFLPFTVKDSIAITFKQLANHTSGLPQVPTGLVINSLLNMDNPYKNFDENALANYLQKDVTLAQKPGDKYSFSNLGMGLLGYTLSQIDSIRIGLLLEECVFDKFNMTHSTIYRDSIKSGLVGGLGENGAPTANWDMAAMAGAGGVLSSASDLAIYARAQCDTANTDLALMREPTFTIGDDQKVGLGWNIQKNDNSEIWYSQKGATGGYTSCIVLNPKTCKAIVVLSNVSKSNSYSDNISKLAYELMEHAK